MERFLSPASGRAARHRPRRRVGAAPRGVPGDPATGSGPQRVSCVSMMDTYRVRHAVRDAGAALGLPPAEVDAIATAFPHIRARDVRHALAELPELASRGLTGSHLDLLFDLVERLDGLPRHIALHPCGVILSDAGHAEPDPGRGQLGRVPDEPVRQGRRRGARVCSSSTSSASGCSRRWPMRSPRWPGSTRARSRSPVVTTRRRRTCRVTESTSTPSRSTTRPPTG